MNTPDGGDGTSEPRSDQAAATGQPGNTELAAATLCTESIARIYVTEPVTVPFDRSIGQVVDLMQRRHAGAVIVVRDQRLVGVFTEHDVVTHLLVNSVSEETPIGQLIARKPIYVLADDDVGKAVGLMAEHCVRHLPVCDQDMNVVGILSVRHLIDCLAEHYPAEVFNRPPRGGLLPSAPEGG